MCVLDKTNGKIALSDAFSLWANMPRKRLMDGLNALADTPCYADDPQHASTLASGVFLLAGAVVSCICGLYKGRLRSVEFYPAGGTAAGQRAWLFQLIQAQDPCVDTMRSVRIRYTFGTAWIAADPRSGGASLRITYAVKE